MKNKIIFVITALVMTFSISACGSDTPTEQITVTATPEVSSPTPSVDVDTIFVDFIHGETDFFDTIPDSQLIDLAHTMCEAWGAGNNFEDIAFVLIDSGFPARQAGFFIGAGTEAYCPEYSNQI